MSKKIVSVKIGGQELDPQKSGAKLLAKVITGRVTKDAVQAAKLLQASEGWKALVGNGIVPVTVVVQSDKETRQYTATSAYVDVLAAIPEDVFGMVSSKVVEGTGKRGRKSTKAVTAEIEF